MIRYYAAKNSFPWVTDLASAMNLDNTDMQGWIEEVASAGELKRDFLKLAGTDNLAKIWVYSTNDSGAGTIANTISVCFQPESKSFRKEENAKFSTDGVEVTDSSCLSQGGTDVCAWCVK